MVSARAASGLATPALALAMAVIGGNPCLRWRPAARTREAVRPSLICRGRAVVRSVRPPGYVPVRKG